MKTKLTKDFFINNGMIKTDANIEEFGITYKYINGKGYFHLINTTIPATTYSDEKCTKANESPIEITDYMAPIFIKKYNKKVINSIIELSMTSDEKEHKYFSELSDSDKFEYLFNNMRYSNKEIEHISNSNINWICGR